MEFHSIGWQEAARRLGTDPKNGLDPETARQRRAQYGENELSGEKGPGFFRRFFAQFKDWMVLILLLSAGVSFALARLRGEGGSIDAAIILAIVVCNGVIGAVQELRADQAIAALKKLSSPKARVVRGGRARTVDSRELVPGDLVLLAPGDLVPADLRLVRTVELRVEESALTGESLPAAKDAQLLCPEEAPLGERVNCAFAGTGVSSGTGVGIVCATGMDTAMGRIAQMLAGEKAPETPLQRKLKQTGQVLGLGVVAICGVIFLLGVLQKTPPLEMLMIAISLGVAAIPEGLTAVVTIVLAMGIRRMAQRRAIVRHLPAVETLGSTQVICSDKTGTLTQNRMTVTAFSGWKGEEPLDGPRAQFALELCSLCTNAARARDRWVGEPTETALLAACAQDKARLEAQWPRVGEIPFTSARKRMTTAHRRPGGYRIITKGAPDVLLSLCTGVDTGSGVLPLGPGQRERLLRENSRLAGRALRVLGVAYKDVESLSEDDGDTESELVFCGLVGMEDPPRPGVARAVAQCKRAGIRPVMITGDHAQTALAVARSIGIAGAQDRALTGAQLDALSDGELTQELDRVRVFARVSPEHKVRLVKGYQKKGLVVAMTGDGVNDAPALKAADIGCAMGQSGTEVAKSAADMVLMDDDFSTIVSAVGEGRGIYRNIRKTIHFLLSCNIGEILVVFMAFLLKTPAPLLAIQLLWVNLVTDSLPALALGADPMEGDGMDEPPHPRSEGIFAGGLGFSVAVEGCLVGALALLGYTMGRVWFDTDPLQPVIGRTMGFAVLSLSQLVHSFNMRSSRSVLKLGLFSNRKLDLACGICALLVAAVVVVPGLAVLFHTAALNAVQWLLVLGLSACPLVAVEGEKLLWAAWDRRKRK